MATTERRLGTSSALSVRPKLTQAFGLKGLVILNGEWGVLLALAEVLNPFTNRVGGDESQERFRGEGGGNEQGVLFLGRGFRFERRHDFGRDRQLFQPRLVQSRDEAELPPAKLAQVRELEAKLHGFSGDRCQISEIRQFADGEVIALLR
jgi:hypothetical protein